MPSLKEAPDLVPLAVDRGTPSEPFGRPSFRPQDLGPCEAVAGALGDQVALDPSEQHEEPSHDLRLDVALALDPERSSLSATKATPGRRRERSSAPSSRRGRRLNVLRAEHS